MDNSCSDQKSDQSLLAEVTNISSVPLNKASMMDNKLRYRRIIYLLFAILMSVPSLTTAQVWVREKPVPPRSQLKIPPKPGDGLVLVPGRWIWDRSAKMYIWLSPVWVVSPKGKIWSPGYWKPQRQGWIWVAGKWENKKRFWQKSS